MSKHGLFVGLVTLDIVYLTAGLPEQNQKVVASDYTVAAGGPATNAAVTFSHLGDRATLLGVVGSNPITQLIRADLESHEVAIADLQPTQLEPPPVSSIIVTRSTGDRAVISINASKNQVSNYSLPLDILEEVDIVLIDGHQLVVGQEIAKLAKLNNIPVVIDAGSWKPSLEQLLPFVDYAICSSNFYPPNCHSSKEVFSYLSSIGIPNIAITCGDKPIQYLNVAEINYLEVSKINSVDTLGAGDVFHGAFCHYILQETVRLTVSALSLRCPEFIEGSKCHNEAFTNALTAASKIASHSCKFFGTRSWIQ